MTWLKLIRGDTLEKGDPPATRATAVVRHSVPDTKWELLAWEPLKGDSGAFKVLVCQNNGPGVPVIARKAGHPACRYWPTGVEVPRDMEKDLHAIVEAILWGVHNDKRVKP